ncbi:MAG: hypothetical protein CMG71_07600 [Candidatus Marinimicrobia bacterium]|nr:hypothetical protein [Candidatus Neomarinimicrobiota bacterium]
MAERRHFIIHSDSLFGNRFILNGDEGHHASRVTRIRIGDEITLLDTAGPAYAGVVEQVKGDTIKGRVSEKIEDYNESATAVHLSVGLLKGSKMDALVEKCTELGVSSISVLRLRNSVKRNVNLERLNRIALSAMKQCGRGLMPEILASDFPHWIDRSVKGEKFVLDESAESETLVSHLASMEKVTQVQLVVGPEGGFTSEELASLITAGFKRASIGPRRLRAETAAITSVAIAEQMAEWSGRE